MVESPVHSCAKDLHSELNEITQLGFITNLGRLTARKSSIKLEFFRKYCLLKDS